jgi:hypothetical protein
MTTPITALALAALLLFSGCVICPSMDDNCWLIKKMNGESTDTTPHPTPEEACVDRGSEAILKAGEYDRCTDGR